MSSRHYMIAGDWWAAITQQARKGLFVRWVIVALSVGLLVFITLITGEQSTPIAFTVSSLVTIVLILISVLGTLDLLPTLKNLIIPAYRAYHAVTMNIIDDLEAEDEVKQQLRSVANSRLTQLDQPFEGDVDEILSDTCEKLARIMAQHGTEH